MVCLHCPTPRFISKQIKMARTGLCGGVHSPKTDDNTGSVYLSVVFVWVAPLEVFSVITASYSILLHFVQISNFVKRKMLLTVFS